MALPTHRHFAELDVYLSIPSDTMAIFCLLWCCHLRIFGEGVSYSSYIFLIQDRAVCAVICPEEFVSGCRHPTAPSVTGNGFLIHRYNLIHEADFIHQLFKTNQGS